MWKITSTVRKGGRGVPLTIKSAAAETVSTSVCTMHTYFPECLSWMFLTIRSPANPWWQKAHWYKSVSEDEKNSRRYKVKNRSMENPRNTFNFFLCHMQQILHKKNPGGTHHRTTRKKKHYSLAKQINSVLHCRGGNTKWLVLKPFFFFFSLSVNRVCCVYTLPFQLRWMALVRVFKAVFCTFLSYSCARAHTHTHTHTHTPFSKVFFFFFSEKYRDTEIISSD